MKYRHFLILFLLLLPIGVSAETLPSFDGITKTMRSNFTITLTDENQVLDDFYVLETKIVEAVIDGYNLIITSKTVSGYGEVLLQRKNTDDLSKIYVIVTGGSITIKQKASETLDGLSVVGAVYEFYDRNNQLADTITIGENLSASCKSLVSGDYTIKQVKAGYGYKVAESFKRKIQSGNFHTSVTVINELIKKEIKILKRLEVQKEVFVPLENIEFEIYRNDTLYETVKTDSNGEIYLNLPYGEYTFTSPEDNLKIVVDENEIPTFYDLTTYYEEVIVPKEEVNEEDLLLEKETLETGEEKLDNENQEIIDHPRTGDNIIFAIINLFTSIFGLFIVKRLLKKKCNK